MRYIQKQANNNLQLSNAHANPPQNSDQAKRRWKAYSGKTVLSNELLQEQFQLCCYSEIRADRLGLAYHIEHVEPKSKNPQRSFDYLNLAASALASDPDLKTLVDNGDECFGGHFKGDEYDAQLFVSCHQKDCVRFFAYLSDGRVEPAAGLEPQDMNKAVYTIKTLNLNSPYLLTLRKKWWEDLNTSLPQHLKNDGVMGQLAAFYLLPANGQLHQFFSFTRQFFGAEAEHVLQRYVPSLV